MGVLFASLLLALTYIGGEAAQVSLGRLRQDRPRVPGAILIFVLACDVFIRYRLHFQPMRRPAARAEDAP